MRHALSLLSGVTVALVCGLILHQTSSLSVLALAGCGIGVALLARAWAYNLPAVRRASVRLRILWRRHGVDTRPMRSAARPFVRQQIGRVNPMWLSYALLTGWALYEMVDETRFNTAPIQDVAASASSAMDAVAGTSAAVRALSAVNGAPLRDVSIGGTELPQSPDTDRLLQVQQTESRSQVMGAAGEIRNGSSGCKTVLEAFLPDPPVNEF